MCTNCSYVLSSLAWIHVANDYSYHFKGFSPFGQVHIVGFVLLFKAIAIIYFLLTSCMFKQLDEVIPIEQFLVQEDVNPAVSIMKNIDASSVRWSVRSFCALMLLYK